VNRIVIIGTTGSGKTTLSHKLAEKLGLQFLDIDDFHWLPDWQERSIDDRARLVDEATNAPKWAISGNYSKLRPIIWPKADTVIWLDYSPLRTLWQLLRRSCSRAYTKEKICNGNTETFAKLITRDSIIVWFFKTYWKNRRQYASLDKQGDYPHIRFLRFSSPRQTQAWIDTL
jgi:adenylate kinase family enzyme